MQYVYTIELSNQSLYIGTTPRLKERINDHNQGKCKSTKMNRPVKLCWYACFRSKDSALKFEKYLKSGSGTAFRHKHLE